MTTVEAAIDAVLGPEVSAHERVLRKGPSRRHLLLPALHSLQDRLGCVSSDALTELARRLEIPRAEAYGAASFYALLDLGDEGSAEVHHICDDIVCRRLPQLDIASEATAHPALVSDSGDRGPAAYVHMPGSQPTRSVVHGGAAAAVTGSIGPPQLLSRVGAVDPTSLDAYVATGGFVALTTAVQIGAAGVIEEVEESGLRGRGGAAFPAGMKWRAVAESDQLERYVVCKRR